MKTEDLVMIEYRGTVQWITRQQYEDLRDGWITAKDLFD